MNIEDVKLGDLVYSYDTLTGEVSQRKVTATFSNTSDHINYLTILDKNGKEQVIETTDGHPFWVVSDTPDLSRAARGYLYENGRWLYHEDVTPTDHGYWVEAKDLRTGDTFLGANGELSTLTNIVRLEQEGGIGIFNFTVEGNHNYFILAKQYEYGQSCILVHNNSIKPPNLTPVGAGRTGAFREAKRMNGIPVSQQPSRVLPNVDKRGVVQPGRVYEFDTPSGKVWIRDDAAGHVYSNAAQNRPPHINVVGTNQHFDY